MKWKTKITDLLGCQYPILQGATNKLGGWELAAAIANTGAHGTITASVSNTPEQLLDDIRKCKNATTGTGTFGVNLSIGRLSRVEDMLNVCIEEQVPIETSLYKPDSLATLIKKSGLPWLHKVARIKDALHVQALGVDAVVLVGLEGGGIKNPNQLPTLTTIRHGVRSLSVPIIAAGGIGDAHGFLGALSLGAEGIMMCSAFLTAKESPVSHQDKESMLTLDLDDVEFRTRVMSPRTFDLKAPQPNQQEINWVNNVSFGVAGITKVLSVKQLVDCMISDATEILNKLNTQITHLN